MEGVSPEGMGRYAICQDSRVRTSSVIGSLDEHGDGFNLY